MSVADQITRLQGAKAAIKASIENKGVTVSDTAKLDEYPALIDSISVGSGDVNTDFYDIRTANGTDYNYLFAYYLYYPGNSNNIKTLDLSNLDTSRVTNMYGTFYYCRASIEGIENWNTSKVTNTSHMFYSFTNNDTYLDLSALDFSSANNVRYMFGFSNTDYLDVRNIDLSGATDYSCLFDQCGGTELVLSNWDVSEVTKLNETFSASDYKKIDLTGWNTNKVTDMRSLFYYAQLLETLIIPDWDMTNATSTNGMFSSTPKLKYIDASRCNNTTMTKLASVLPTRTSDNCGEIKVPVDLAQEIIDAFAAKYWNIVIE